MRIFVRLLIVVAALFAAGVIAYVTFIVYVALRMAGGMQ